MSAFRRLGGRGGGGAGGGRDAGGGRAGLSGPRRRVGGGRAAAMDVAGAGDVVALIHTSRFGAAGGGDEAGLGAILQLLGVALLVEGFRLQAFMQGLHSLAPQLFGIQGLGAVEALIIVVAEPGGPHVVSGAAAEIHVLIVAGGTGFAEDLPPLPLVADTVVAGALGDNLLEDAPPYTA